MPATSSPLVSIGIPTYNRPDGLRRTLQAITSQSHRNLEIIVSDNCSPDPQIGAIALEFAATDQRITYVRQATNIGAVANFRALLALAHGDYFMWAADDDWWDEQFVECTVKLLDGSPEAAVAVPRFRPLSNEQNPKQMHPPYFEHIEEFVGLPLVERMRRYIKQREAFGKAHIIYGLMRREMAVDSFHTTIRIIEELTNPHEFQPLDTVFNAVLLSHGGIVTSQQCLRKFAAGNRQAGRGNYQTLMQRILRYNQSSIVYFNTYHEIIKGLKISDREKRQLHHVVTWRKTGFFLERIGRALFIYRIYRHFRKHRTHQR